jgi:hypothetical protein
MDARIIGLTTGNGRGVGRFGAVEALHAMRAVTKWLVFGETTATQGVAVRAGNDVAFLPDHELAMFRTWDIHPAPFYQDPVCGSPGLKGSRGDLKVSGSN